MDTNRADRMTAEPLGDDDVVDFSFDLRLEISRALTAYLSRGAPAHARLLEATKRVCTEAHALNLSPEELVATLRRMFARMPLAVDAEPERREAAWNEFTQSCIGAYFNAGDNA